MEVKIAIVVQENTRVRTLNCKELSGFGNVQIFGLNVAHRRLFEHLNLSKFSLLSQLVLLNSLSPSLLNHKILLVDEESKHKERGGKQLHIAQNCDNEIIVRRYVGHVIVSTVWSEHLIVSVLPDNDECDAYCQNS